MIMLTLMILAVGKLQFVPVGALRKDTAAFVQGAFEMNSTSNTPQQDAYQTFYLDYFPRNKKSTLRDCIESIEAGVEEATRRIEECHFCLFCETRAIRKSPNVFWDDVCEKVEAVKKGKKHTWWTMCVLSAEDKVARSRVKQASKKMKKARKPKKAKKA
mmetsp:Transcript_47250/g.74679  ORF Transcript_47250/g.74679 Transcript_47250/m.74679 type:complete len:159 (+) Transcript_47250:73-549(+)|eukprot:CAMPEP_0169279700 /NCGR_PEP_ID=MMETSP1016-20121227/55153_1 /TAXON_ID=342587 /ORGANISM="Karlodinium micrum, Strain CCMP2283" /LENGTH=158 /DNA_ID=CAMNT_0009367855 /DNA_START=73 /DNA_END=546 /DNA_ORIENTATION=+